MTHEHVFTLALLDIPDTEGSVARTRDSGGRVGHLQTSDCGSMTTQHVKGLSIENGQRCVCIQQDEVSHLPGRHVPNTDVSVATT
jgi:hypothetical protein